MQQQWHDVSFSTNRQHMPPVRRDAYGGMPEWAPPQKAGRPVSPRAPAGPGPLRQPSLHTGSMGAGWGSTGPPGYGRERQPLPQPPRRQQQPQHSTQPSSASQWGFQSVLPHASTPSMPVGGPGRHPHQRHSQHPQQQNLNHLHPPQQRQQRQQRQSAYGALPGQHGMPPPQIPQSQLLSPDILGNKSPRRTNSRRSHRSEGPMSPRYSEAGSNEEAGLFSHLRRLAKKATQRFGGSDDAEDAEDADVDQIDSSWSSASLRAMKSSDCSSKSSIGYPGSGASGGRRVSTVSGRSGMTSNHSGRSSPKTPEITAPPAPQHATHLRSKKPVEIGNFASWEGKVNMELRRCSESSDDEEDNVDLKADREQEVDSLVKANGWLSQVMIDANGPKHSVELRVYDISEGKAAMWSDWVMDKPVEGIYHTGLYVYGYEYFYGDGILRMLPHEVEDSYAMTLIRTHHLGETICNRQIFEKLLHCINPVFQRSHYDLMQWNCNDFTNVCAKRLLGEPIPSYILKQPEEVCSTPLGRCAVFWVKVTYGTAKPEDIFGKGIVSAASKLKKQLKGEVV